MKILIYGINGKMGRILTEEILKDNELILVGGVSSKDTFNKDIKVYRNLEELEGITIDCIIDFSHYSNLSKILNYSIKNNVSLVLGATGYNEDDFNLIKDASRHIPIIYSANYSRGIHTIIKSLEDYVTSLSDFDIDIIEKHHKEKQDKPSGTAKKFISEINKHSDKSIDSQCIRSGNIVGEHTIMFSGIDEVIEINHKITSKRVFALGAIKAAKFIKNKHYGLYSMDDLLGGD